MQRRGFGITLGIGVIACMTGLTYAEDCLELVVDDCTAGETTIFHVSGAEPGRDLAVVWSLNLGNDYREGNGWCANLGIILPNNPWQAVVCGGEADAEGYFEHFVYISEVAEGRTIHFQAAMQGTCPDSCVSNIVTCDY